MSFTAIAHQMLKVRPRRGGGVSSYFGGDVAAVDALSDSFLSGGVAGRTGLLAAIESALSDRFMATASGTIVSRFAGCNLPIAPELFDVPYSLPPGTTHTPSNNAQLATALASAALGDVIVLTAGVDYGRITLPNKTTGSGWIYIVSSALASLPPTGTRVSPADASNMPKLTTTGASGLPAITNANGAHHFRIVGVEIYATSGFVYTLVEHGNGVSSVANLPRHITYDRCYVRGNVTLGGRRGFQLDGAYMAVVDSHVEEFKEVGADSQAIVGWNGTGPYMIHNNFLSAAGEVVMFGGAETSIANNTPSDIVITSNHLFKPRSWIPTTPSNWYIKNLLEFKHARRAKVWHNTLENNWEDAQVGLSFLITPRNENGGNPWATVEDIDFQYNEFIGTDQGINIFGTDNNNPSGRTARILIRNNLIRALQLVGNQNRSIQITAGPVDVVIDHNVMINQDVFAYSENLGTPANRFAFTNNIAERSAALGGFAGSGTSEGTDTLNTYFTNYVFRGNVIWGASGGTYPSGNYFQPSSSGVGFVDFANGNYALAAGSQYKGSGIDGNGTPDGTDPGIINFAFLGEQ
jgi:hypothetical protein